MKFIANLFRAVFGVKSVASITGQLTTIVSDLEAHASTQQTAAIDARSKATSIIETAESKAGAVLAAAEQKATALRLDASATHFELSTAAQAAEAEVAKALAVAKNVGALLAA